MLVNIFSFSKQQRSLQKGMTEEIWIVEDNLWYAILFQLIKNVQRREVTPTLAARGWPQIYFCCTGSCIPLSCHDYLHIQYPVKVQSHPCCVAASVMGLWSGGAGRTASSSIRPCRSWMLQDAHLAHVKKKHCFSHSGYMTGHGRETAAETWKAASRQDLRVLVDSGET